MLRKLQYFVFLLLLSAVSLAASPTESFSTMTDLELSTRLQTNNSLILNYTIASSRASSETNKYILSLQDSLKISEANSVQLQTLISEQELSLTKTNDSLKSSIEDLEKERSNRLKWALGGAIAGLIVGGIVNALSP